MTPKERKLPPPTSERVPVSFFQVDESSVGGFWEVHMERASQLDNDWKVVGTEGHEGSPLRIQGYVGSGYCDVG